MTSTELAIPQSRYALLNPRDAHMYTVRSAEWAWNLITWFYQDGDYARKHPHVYDVAREAMQLNAQWAESDRRARAEEAIERLQQGGTLQGEDFLLISRYDDLEEALGLAIIDASGAWDDVNKTHTEYDGEEWLPDEAAMVLSDTLQRFQNAGLDIHFQGANSVRIASSDTDAYVYQDTHGIWEWSVK